MSGARKGPNHGRTALYLSATVAGMLGLTYASVPLYDLFCRVTGYGGTPQRASEAEARAVTTDAREFTIRFDANISGGLPWTFKPEQTSVTVKAGEQKVVFYKAINHSDRPVTGRATFNVTPDKTGPYFVKVDCFCFTEQTLQPGQDVDMPVLFYVDPAVSDDNRLNEVKTITLSYTFFRDANDVPAASATQGAPGATTN
ncbi:cytochrome c oxidase assembly protein [Zavarzinia compransoris]|uniref:Cytochrome c oxidase assembly protein CtaG n=1 Tax=Zavarzinia compransoris TaxID=1264899 RepID=A0A317E152_9PROT|nr:cytochrome c oxidase assembly protein [Zavarzinia compransoris]PWR19850.1 cytochrome c oxidase assembly protein [Zavarzinia compransoris]TDP45041.1 cytochrome c oxidase assembly protein subunit 11 [Zavarzinia compransoris]